MSAARTKNDDCLLCRKRKADAENSHIYTKFITRSIFGDRKLNQGGGQINSANVEYGEPAFDTVKEDHILCINCERIRLCRLETYVSTHFYNRYRNPRFADAFPIEKRYNLITEELDCIICEKLHTGLFKLFIYSQIWRASISTDNAYKNFKLSPELEETLRHTLDTFLKDTADETIAYYDEHVADFPQFQFTIVTPKDQSESIGNFVAEPYDAGNGTFLMVLNEFAIIFYSKWNEGRKFARAFNPGAYPINVAIVTEEEWKDSVINPLVGMLVKSVKHTMRKAMIAEAKAKAESKRR
ncbi:hypothetical protein [Hymenobacter armeniacus]|uniref:Uncharacterized protein n=1 Tax=Hymenobacter armeniacus TaxID=2771358 RepID=A0ABR8JQH8_9BACT|nr:hypothetical protein [Hymenobacter armeniacus]MBD2720812.1 hypothetical protein [Hymenobacter armeniacus]